MPDSDHSSFIEHMATLETGEHMGVADLDADDPINCE